MLQGKLHQLDLPEDKNLKLVRDRFEWQNFCRAEMTGSSVVYQNVEVTSFGERGVECVFDGMPIGKVETNRMQSRHFWDALHIAGCTPHFVTFSDESLCEGQTNTRTRTSEKNSLHDFEICFASLRRSTCVATDLIPILTIAWMQEFLPIPPALRPVLKNSCKFNMSILSRCGR